MNHRITWAARLIRLQDKSITWQDAVRWAWQCYHDALERLETQRKRSEEKCREFFQKFRSPERKFTRKLHLARSLPQDGVWNSREYDGSGGVIHVLREREDHSEIGPSLMDDPYYRATG